LRSRYGAPIPRLPEMNDMSSDAFQVCFHPKLGVVINDPVAQMGLAREQMRLFKLAPMGASTFMRSIVSKDLAPCTDEQLTTNSEAVDTYRSARSGRRKPYCEGCRRHYGSVDFTVCSDCSAIRCTCGTCSCVSSSRRRKAA
jgi:hypothetical protein